MVKDAVGVGEAHILGSWARRAVHNMSMTKMTEGRRGVMVIARVMSCHSAAAATSQTFVVSRDLVEQSVVGLSR